MFHVVCAIVFVRCEKSFVTIQSSVSKSALKEKEQTQSAQGPNKTGAEQNKNKDFDKFHLYFDFTCNIQRIQSHQVTRLAAWIYIFHYADTDYFCLWFFLQMSA